MKSASERAEIAQIESDEWRHRESLGEMLAEMGAGPRSLRELWMVCIGTFISLFCRVGGWFIPMYGAGKLERGNIVEYEVAARLAFECGLTRYVECLLEMAEVEWDHELYFRSKASSHPWWRWFPGWPAPPPREEIRRGFRQYEALAAPEPAKSGAPRELPAQVS